MRVGRQLNMSRHVTFFRIHNHNGIGIRNALRLDARPRQRVLWRQFIKIGLEQLVVPRLGRLEDVLRHPSKVPERVFLEGRVEIFEDAEARAVPGKPVQGGFLYYLENQIRAAEAKRRPARERRSSSS